MLENPVRLQWTHDSLQSLADILFSQIEATSAYHENEVAASVD
jgi:hypothetical protein